jgi:hypothetical protein
VEPAPLPTRIDLLGKVSQECRVVGPADEAFVAAYQAGQSLTPDQSATEALALADKLMNTPDS